MNQSPYRLLLLVCAGLFGLSGASCPQYIRQYTNPQPRILPPKPTLEQVIEAVNRNNSQIQSFSANNATVSGHGFPSLRANVVFQRPKRFRLRAEATSLTGAEFDLGSNDDLFWFWVRREQPPALYYCRHEEFAMSQARQAIPIQPDRLIEAMGIAEFDPALPHQGPYPLPNDRLRIDTICNTPEGPTKKITIVDGSQGWILEQHMYDARQQLVASSFASGHQRDLVTNLVMPKTVEVRCPAAKFSMRIDLGAVQINQPPANAAELWTMPQYPNTPLVNLATLNSPMAAQPMPPGVGNPMPPTSANWRATRR